MRVLICGSRDWKDQEIVDIVVSGLMVEYSGFDKEGLVVINGKAPGADSCARIAAEQHRDNGERVRPQNFPADWTTFGNAAGPIRNQQMLDEGKPDLVIAFNDDISNSKGTRDMVRRAKQAGLPTFVISRA